MILALSLSKGGGLVIFCIEVKNVIALSWQVTSGKWQVTSGVCGQKNVTAFQCAYAFL